MPTHLATYVATSLKTKSIAKQSGTNGHNFRAISARIFGNTFAQTRRCCKPTHLRDSVCTHSQVFVSQPPIPPQPPRCALSGCAGDRSWRARLGWVSGVRRSATAGAQATITKTLLLGFGLIEGLLQRLLVTRAGPLMLLKLVLKILL